MRALYDLSDQLTSFNFYEWLVQANGLGATKVVFDIRKIRKDKWEDAEHRFWSICYPGPELAGLEKELCWDGEPEAANVARWGGKEIVDYWRSGKPFHRLKSVKPPLNARYTVTLRKTPQTKRGWKTIYRDSDEAVWLDFASEIGAVVIEDYHVTPIHLHDRMALYAGAEMNFFVSNGPGVLCSMTEYPCMLFNTQHALKALLRDGLKIGDQYPWMLENQKTLWELATPESLRRHFYHWKEKGTFARDEYTPPA